VAVLREIPIQQLIIPVPQVEHTIDFPESNLPGNWNVAVITLTNNYVDETYPLTNDDVVLALHLKLKKGSTDGVGIFVTVDGGQIINSRTGLPVKRSIIINRPSNTTGTLKIYGTITFYVNLEIGASVEYF